MVVVQLSRTLLYQGFRYPINRAIKPIMHVRCYNRLILLQAIYIYIYFMHLLAGTCFVTQCAVNELSANNCLTNATGQLIL